MEFMQFLRIFIEIYYFVAFAMTFWVVTKADGHYKKFRAHTQSVRLLLKQYIIDNSHVTSESRLHEILEKCFNDFDEQFKELPIIKYDFIQLYLKSMWLLFNFQLPKVLYRPINDYLNLKPEEIFISIINKVDKQS